MTADVSERTESIEQTRQLVSALGRRWPIVMTCLVLASLAGYVASSSRQNTYTATSILLFRDAGLDDSLFGGLADTSKQNADRRAATNADLVALPVVARRAADALGRGYTQRQVQKMIKVESKGESDLVSITAKAPSGGQAARVANVMARQFIAFRREADRAKVNQARVLVERQLEQYSPSARRSDPAARELDQRVQQLRVLSALQTGNAELAQAAAPPQSAASPKPVRDTILAGVFGVLFGLGIAFLRVRFDRQVRTPDELEALWGRPVLATVPEARSLAEGAAAPPEQSIFEAFALARTRIRYFHVDRDVRVLAITSAIAEEGKSTVAWNLAAVAAASGTRVLLLEADLRRPTLLQRRGIGPGPGVAEVITGITLLEQAIRRVELSGTATAHGPAVIDVLPAGAIPPNPLELLESDRFIHLVAEMRASYDLVVLDSPPAGLVSDAFPIIRQADGVLIVARLGYNSQRATRALRGNLEHMSAPVLGLIANGAKGHPAGYYAYGSTSDSPAGGVDARPLEQQSAV